MGITTTATTAKTTVSLIENQEQLFAIYPFLRQSPPWYVDRYWVLYNQGLLTERRKPVTDPPLPKDPVRRALRLLEDQREFMKPGLGFVYFLHSPTCKAIKIGRSRNIDGRLRGLRTGCPGEAKFIAVIEGRMSLERDFQHCFAKYRLYGEWFKDQPVLRLVSALPEWAR